MNLKSLARDTAIYGISSIVGRFLNYLLVPLYTYKISAESGGYGIVTNLYAYSALLLALLTFGMETTFFRFSGKSGEDGRMVYSNALRMVGGVALVFVALVMAFLGPIAGAMGYGDHPEYIACFALIAGLDAFQAIMFARLRQQRRPVKFMSLKMAFIFANVALNLFIFLVMPRVNGLADIYGRFNGGVGLIFFANLICTAAVTLGFIPEIRGIGYGFDRDLARRMLSYSMPLLLLSLVGILNQVADKILFPYLMPGHEGQVQLGIYGACVKIAMIMSLLTQAFRYAYEPIVFAGGKGSGSEGGNGGSRPETLAEGMKWFVVFAVMAWLAVMFYMPLLRHFIQPGYWSGLRVVPIVMAAEIFMGVYFNLSFWYKLTDKTWWGAVMSACGAAVMIAFNVALVPRWGYMACAWGGFAGYGVAMLMSALIGRAHYPVRYDVAGMLRYVAAAAVLYAVYALVPVGNIWKMALGTALLAAYALLAWRELRTRSVAGIS